jgi:hypothetical protein
MRRTLLVGLGLLTVLSLIACEGLEAEADKKTRSSLTGIWFAVTEEPDEGSDKTITVQSWLVLNPDGKFSEKLKGLYPDGRILDAGSDGEWLVTDDLFKLRYVAVNGKNLRRHDLSTMYAFKIADMTKNAFTYKNPLEPKRQSLTMRRVPEIGKEP